MADPTTPPPPPPPVPQPPPGIPTAQSAPSAVWSLILGILSFVCCGFFTAIPAIIFGHIGRSTVQKSGGALGGMGMATAGLVLGYLALVLNLILIPALAIPALLKARDARVEHGSGHTREIVSADRNIRLNVPKDWSELKDLNDAAELQTGNRGKEQFVIVLSETKADFDNMTLQKHHQITRDAIVEKMKNATAGESAEVTIDGRPAIQDEIGGTQDGTNIVFLHTTVEGNESFHQILAWTSKSRWDRQKEKLREITRSFRSTR